MQKGQDLATQHLEPSTMGLSLQTDIATSATDFQPDVFGSQCTTQNDFVPAMANVPMGADMDIDAFDVFDGTLWNSEIAMNIPGWPSLSELDQFPVNL